MGFSQQIAPPEVIEAAFGRALAAADALRGSTSPNPPVGCVLLDEAGTELAVAAHRRAGEPHAEALALELCRSRGTTDRIAHVVVTLEPCNHHGRTPPCAEAILATPARFVWIGARDPNPKVAGGGAARLAAAGLAVSWLDSQAGPVAQALAQSCQDLIGPFAKRVTTGRPWVTVKQALDPSGSMIPPPGRTTFTSPPALAFAHRLRRRADAVMTGSGTVLADRPAFTVRLVPDFGGKRRHLVLLDRRGRIDPSYIARAEANGFIVLLADDIEAALAALGAEGANEVLVEAGPMLTAAVLNTTLWDEHVLIRQAPEAAAPDTVDVIRRLSGRIDRVPLPAEAGPG